MSELVNEFSKNEYLSLSLVLYGLTREIFYQIPDSIKVFKPSFDFNNKLRIYYTLRTFFYLRKQIKTINPDTILSFGEYWNSFVLFSLLGTKYKVYISDRCQPTKRLKHLHELLRKILYRTAAGIITQTHIAKIVYSKLIGHKNITVISNPVRTINSNKEILRENIVLTVGRLIQTKHHDELIKIFAEINNPAWKLIIVGDDALKQKNSTKLKELISDLNIQNNVILTGKTNNVDDYYLRSKIFAFTSSSEGFPNVLLEALSAGLPVISYDCVAGPSEIVNDNVNGFLIPLFDREKFKSKLEILMNDDTLCAKLAANSRNSIVKYNSQIIADKYLKTILGDG